ncbi:MAG: GNAT family N-acetyltransferase [Actinobacteria bacterium]|nr:GNAT family N-acetyltransferase [Actinomycetota bacterium]
MKILVSACLLGEPCRYDGGGSEDKHVSALRATHELLPVCPEQLGKLPTPRSRSEIDASLRYALVRTETGEDVTDAFLSGAQAVLEIARKSGCSLAILKEKSPSCGSGYVYDGTFSGVIIPGSGITARRLREEGIRVVSEDQVHTCSDALFASTSLETPPIETERLILRPLTEDDAKDVFEYSKNPAVGPNAGWMPHRSVEDSRAYIESIASAPHVYGIFHKESGVNIGSIGLIKETRRKNPDSMVLGYALAQPWWGQGYMTEAAREVIRYGFEDLGLSLITCDHYLFNSRSERVIDKCGFKSEGTLRAAEATPDGIMQDVILYSLTKQEYFSERQI